MSTINHSYQQKIKNLLSAGYNIYPKNQSNPKKSDRNTQQDKINNFKILLASSPKNDYSIDMKNPLRPNSDRIHIFDNVTNNGIINILPEPENVSNGNLNMPTTLLSYPRQIVVKQNRLNISPKWLQHDNMSSLSNTVNLGITHLNNKTMDEIYMKKDKKAKQNFIEPDKFNFLKETIRGIEEDDDGGIIGNEYEDNNNGDIKLINLSQIGSDNIYFKPDEIIQNNGIMDVNSATAALTKSKNIEFHKPSGLKYRPKTIDKKSLSNTTNKIISNILNSPNMVHIPKSMSPKKDKKVLNNYCILNNREMRSKAPKKSRVTNSSKTNLNNTTIINSSNLRLGTSHNNNNNKTKNIKRINQSYEIIRHSQSPDLSQNLSKNHNNGDNSMGKTLQKFENLTIILPNKGICSKHYSVNKNSNMNTKDMECSNQDSKVNNEKFSMYNKAAKPPKTKSENIFKSKKFGEIKNKLLSCYDLLIERDISNAKVLENLKSNVNIFMEEFMKNFYMVKDLTKTQEYFEQENERLRKERHFFESKYHECKKENELLHKQQQKQNECDHCLSYQTGSTAANKSLIHSRNESLSGIQEYSNGVGPKKNRERRTSCATREQELIKENEKLKMILRKQHEKIIEMKKKELKYIKLLSKFRKDGNSAQQKLDQDDNSIDNLQSNSKRNAYGSSFLHWTMNCPPEIDSGDSWARKSANREPNIPISSSIHKNPEISSPFLNDNNDTTRHNNKESLDFVNEVNNSKSKRGNGFHKSLPNSPSRTIKIEDYEQIECGDNSVNRSRPKLKLNLDLLRNARSVDTKIKSGNDNNYDSEPIGFHQEFMSKFDEFSLSWRQAAMKEKKF